MKGAAGGPGPAAFFKWQPEGDRDLRDPPFTPAGGLDCLLACCFRAIRLLTQQLRSPSGCPGRSLLGPSLEVTVSLLP